MTTFATEEHFKYLLRVLRYLKSTTDVKLVYKSNPNAQPIEAYVDASWASTEECRSTSGYFIRVFGNLVEYKSKRQTVVALSTTEAEYVALSEAGREICWIRGILIELGINVESATVYEDNQSCIKIAENRTNYKRTKHLELKYHYVKYLINKNVLKLMYGESSKQIADILNLRKLLLARLWGSVVIQCNLAMFSLTFSVT